MAPWPNEFMLGTDLDTDFNTLNDILETSEAVDPDATFAEYSGFHEDLNRARTGIGFPVITWKRQGWTDRHIEIFQDEFWNGLLSVPLYVRTLINRLDMDESSERYGERLFRTYLTQAIWIPLEPDKQAGHTLDFEWQFRHCILQAEAV